MLILTEFCLSFSWKETTNILYSEMNNLNNEHISNAPVIKVVNSSIHCHSEAAESVAKLKKYNFLYSFRPIYYLSRTVGLMPFSFTYNSIGVVQSARISRLDCLWMVISIFVDLRLCPPKIWNVGLIKFHLLWATEVWYTWWLVWYVEVSWS